MSAPGIHAPDAVNVEASPSGDRPPLDAASARLAAQTISAFADPARLRLLSLLATDEHDETCECNLTGSVGVSRELATGHLEGLVRAGLITQLLRGGWVYYRLRDSARSHLVALLGQPGPR